MPRAHMVLLSILTLALLHMNNNAMAQTPTPPVPPEWQTRAEKTDYRETARYDETIALIC